MSDGWDASAKAWIASQGSDGDFSRHHVLYTPMLARVQAAMPKHVLDLGCGEGRFCRKLTSLVDNVVGIAPTQALIAQAKSLGQATYH